MRILWKNGWNYNTRTYITLISCLPNESQLQILKIRRAYPRCELIKFLENNGKNLKEFYLGDYGGYSDNLLNLDIIKLCPNLRKLSTRFENHELQTLKMFLIVASI